MWDAFNNVLEKGGVVAALFFVVIASSGLAVRALWLSNEKQRKEFAEKLDELTEAHQQAIDAVSDEHRKSTLALADELGKQIAAVVGKNHELQSKLDSIQERRVVETKDSTERVMAYIKHIDAFVLKLEAAIDVLLRASRGGDGR